MTARQLRNQRLTDEEFFEERQEVLALWPTGKEVDFDDAVEFHKSLPDSRVYAAALRKAKRDGDTLVHSFNGTPTLEGQIELVRYIVEEGGADLGTTHCDAFTRNQMFARAEESLKESIKQGKAMLNGFPIIIHGVAGNRKLIQAYPVPSQISGTSCDWRLNAEVGFAGGHNSICTGPFFAFFNYNRDTRIEAAIRNWQYVFRLIGCYDEKGVPIVSRPDGVISGYTLCPPSIGAACRVIEHLIAAEQGAKRFSVLSHANCCLPQDLADAIITPRLVREYLDRFGYNDVELFTMSIGMTGRYPRDHARSFPVVTTGPLVAALAGLQETCIFTIDEAREIPTKENNAASVRCAKMTVNLYKGQRLGLEESEEIRTEVKMQELEMRSIIEKVLELGDGDVAVGAVRAVDTGVLDIPFTTSRQAARRVLGVRDAGGAIRYLDHGNLPFGRETLEFHREKIAQRGRKQNKNISYEAVIKDLVSVSEGQVVSA